MKSAIHRTVCASISVASGIDALFSLLPDVGHVYKIILSVGIILGMVYLNLRGVKESIKILMPIFIGFVITHGFLIVCKGTIVKEFAKP